MLFEKHKKMIIGLAALAAVSVGSVTSVFAAAPGFTLTPVYGVDVTKIQGPMGESKIAGDIDQKILDGLKGSTTAPGLSAPLTLTPVYGVDVSKIKGEKGDSFQLEKGKKIDPQIIGGQTKATAPRVQR